MNCFEARKEFPSFWRRILTPEERTAFLAHVGRCARCDHAFRVFAMTAPVLHGDSESREPMGVAQAPVATHESTPFAWRVPVPTSRRGAPVTPFVPRASRTVWAAAALAAAALFAVYVAAATPGQTFEDAITGEDTVSDISTTTPESAVFGDAVLDQDTMTQDPVAQPNGGANGVAG